MTKYLILVKHSVPEMQADRPANSWKLSEEGRMRARRLAQELESYQPEVIVSSDEPKAVETAEVLAAHLSLSLQTHTDLREHDRRNVPFLSHDEFQRSIGELFQKPEVLVFGNETAEQAHARFYRLVHSLLNEHRNKTVVLVTHGTVISLFIAQLTGTSALDLWNRLGLPSFVALDLDSSTVIVKSNIV